VEERRKLEALHSREADLGIREADLGIREGGLDIREEDRREGNRRDILEVGRRDSRVGDLRSREEELQEELQEDILEERHNLEEGRDMEEEHQIDRLGREEER
jgi:hypothetical protein